MSTVSLQTVRISNLFQGSLATQTINDTQQQLVEVEQELSTGKAVSQPSDNPSSAAVIEQLQKTIDYRAQYSTNITQGSSQLSEVDSTLGSLTALLTQAQSIASQNASSTVSAEARTSAAAVIDSIYSQSLTMANGQYEGTYLFGADTATTAPFVATAAGVQFAGTASTLSNTFDQGTDLNFQVSAAAAFGGSSPSVSTGTNVSPQLTAATRVVDLAGATGKGVQLGAIRIGNGTVSKSVDLTGADSVGDVVDAINAAAIPGVTATLSQYGISLSAGGGADVTVGEVGGGATAEELSIVHAVPSGAGVPVVGGNVAAKVTDFTPIAGLRGGGGLDPAGFRITNGTTTKTISMVGLNTVQDLINSVNGSGTGVRAAVNATGTGIDLTNVTQGASLSVSEVGGTTAAQLGFRTYSTATAIGSLNNGRGVSTPAGNQFSLTTADGSVVNVALSNLTTVQDVLNQINTAAAGKVTAGFTTTGNGIVLTDNTTGAGKLTLTPLNAASTAADLGLTGASVGNTITGTDVAGVKTPGLFTDLQALRDALRGNDTAGITAAAVALQGDGQTVSNLQGTVGARTQELNNRSASIQTENVATQSLLSQFQDVDYTTAITKYQALQNSLQASLQVTAKSLNLSLLNYLG